MHESDPNARSVEELAVGMVGSRSERSAGLDTRVTNDLSVTRRRVFGRSSSCYRDIGGRWSR